MPRSTSTALDRAQVALTTAKRRVEDRKESKIDKVFESLQSSEASAVKDVTLQVFSVVKSQIGAFVQSSEGLMKVLDEVSKLHPFISIAVIPFKAALALELKRLDNDKKVLALFTQMNEMMSTLRVLETIKPNELGTEGVKVADRMNQRLKDAATTIQDCSHATHDYYKMKFIPKLIKSNSWEDKFTTFATTFGDLGNGLATDLALYTGAGVQAIHRVVGRLDEKMDLLMKLVFETLASPEEQELSHFIKTKGGADKFVEDDKLLQELIHKRDSQLSRNSGSSASAGVPQQGKSSTSFIEIKEQLKGSLDKSLAESKAFFDRKFEEQKNQLSEVKRVVRHESDRIIDEILSGPADRIRDKALHAMWIEMGWKGSAKARHVVLAIRDFYSDQLLHTIQDTKNLDTVPPTPITPISEKHLEEKHRKTRDLLADLPPLNADDIWAIKSINSVRLKPLQEALDPDCSDFVTIHELNEFTSARPKDWSLPLWLAYWTSGFEVTLRQYAYRIRAIFAEISSIYRSLMPGNAGAYSDLFDSYALNQIDAIVAAIHTLSADDLAQEYPHNEFRKYAAEVESRIEKRLKSFDYLIDEQNTLSLVIGTGRLEECLFPLLYLILRRIKTVLSKGQTRVLRDSDFENTLTSLETIWTVAYDRTDILKGTFRLRNVVVNEELKKYCRALYYFFAVGNEELDVASGYYNMPDSYYDPPISDLNSEIDEEESAKDKEPDAEPSLPEDDMASALEAFTKLQIPSDGESSGPRGLWNGFYYYGFSANHTDGIMGFRIDSIGDDNTFTGGGTDALADFDIKGSLKGQEISFLKEYQQLVQGDKLSWFYSGTINDSCDTITGEWGRPPKAPLNETSETEPDGESGDSDDDSEERNTTAGGGGRDMLGTFTVQKKSAEYIRFRPSEEAILENKPRALWKFALDAVTDSLSQHTLRWSTLEKRRNQRRRFILLWTEYQARGLSNTSEYEELHKLETQLSPVDLRFYRYLSRMVESRKVVHHASCDCCSKSPIVMTRYICLPCSTGHYIHTVDICGDCVDKEFTVLRNEGKQVLKHVLSHSLLQIRRPFAMRIQYTARENARITLDDTPDSTREASGLPCNVCKKLIKERPYWSCCECWGEILFQGRNRLLTLPDVFVCHACNLKIEKDQPWLYEVRDTETSKKNNDDKNSSASVPDTEGTRDGDNDSSASGAEETENDGTNSSDDTEEDQPTQSAHHWSHDLVSITKPEPLKKPLSVEERLTNLEERFEKQSKVIEGIEESVGDTTKRLERLENLLLQFIKVSTTQKRF